jgi:hypothetical protein
MPCEFLKIRAVMRASCPESTYGLDGDSQSNAGQHLSLCREWMGNDE